MTFEYIPVCNESFLNDAKLKTFNYVFVKPKDFSKVPINLDNWTPKSCILSTRYEKLADKIKNLEVHQDDVWLCTFPKSGTTWASEMIWLICNNLDYEGAKASIMDRFPFMEYEIVFKIRSCNGKYNFSFIF